MFVNPQSLQHIRQRVSAPKFDGAAKRLHFLAGVALRQQFERPRLPDDLLSQQPVDRANPQILVVPLPGLKVVEYGRLSG